MGKVIKQIKRRDDILRAVKTLITSQGKTFEIERPLQGMRPLEIHAPVKE